MIDIGKDLQNAYEEGYKQGRYDEKVETEMSLPQRWIPVSERLPEELKDVLVCTKRGYVTCGCCVNDYNYRCVDKDLFLNLGDVVAWMPLPEPYRDADTTGGQI